MPLKRGRPTETIAPAAIPRRRCRREIGLRGMLIAMTFLLPSLLREGNVAEPVAGHQAGHQALVLAARLVERLVQQRDLRVVVAVLVAAGGETVDAAGPAGARLRAFPHPRRPPPRGTGGRSVPGAVPRRGR